MNTRLFTKKADSTTTVANTYPASTPVLSLRYSALQGNVSSIEKALNRGEKINEPGTLSKDTALHMAASKGHFEAVKYLISRGAHSEVKNANNKTPIKLAEDNAHLKITSFLHVINLCHEAKQFARAHVASGLDNELTRVGMIFLAEKLKDSGVALHQLSGSPTIDVHHTVLIIGLPSTYKLLDTKTWGDAIVCDFNTKLKYSTIYSASYPPSASFITDIELIDKLLLTPYKISTDKVFLDTLKAMGNLTVSEKPPALAKPK